MPVDPTSDRVRPRSAAGACISMLADRRLLAWTALLTLVSGLLFGLVSAIIPNPVFGRSVPPEPFAYWVWLLSAPLMGLVLATYVVPLAPIRSGVPQPLVTGDAAVLERRSSRLGSVAGLAAFLAIGCPVCNKVALVLLGASGAMSFWAPLQPIIGAASLVLLAVTAAWRLRLRANGGTCPA
jgi:hypothetical protein